MKKLLLVVMCMLCLVGCNNFCFVDKHEALIDEFRCREDFLLRVEYKYYGVTFCPKFIVHLIGQGETNLKDMDMVVMDKDGLVEVLQSQE